ncbi:MAG: ABC transporter permease [bacterium]
MSSAKLQFFIARRYLFSRRKEVFLLISTLISILGITIGVAALLITLSVMNGFHTDLKNKFVSTSSPINVLLPATYSRDEWTKLMTEICGVKGVSACAPYVLNQAVFTKRTRSQGIAVKGIDTEKEKSVTAIKNQITEGNYSLEGGEIFVGSELARSFGLGAGDSVFLTLPPAEMAAFTGGRVGEFKIAGIFSSGMWEYDMNLVYINIRRMQQLYGLGDSITGIEVALYDADKADSIAALIREKMTHRLWVRTWKETNRTLFAALELEKKMMFIILSLIVMVAVFNIISSLLLQTIEKVKDIGVLKAVGADRKFIEGIFAFQGLINGTFGIVLGNIIAVVVCVLLKRYRFIEIPAEVYYLDKLPVIMSLRDFILVDAVSIILTFFASFIPARQAGKISPAAALKYE